MIRIEGLNIVSEMDEELYKKVKPILEERIRLKLDKTPTPNYLIDPHTVASILDTKLGFKILPGEVLLALGRICKENNWNMSMWEVKLEFSSLPFVLLLFINLFI